MAMAFRELVGEREDEHHQHLLVCRIYLEDVTADALRRPALVDETISLSFLARARNGFLRNRLELELFFPFALPADGPRLCPSDFLPRLRRTSFRSGS